MEPCRFIAAVAFVSVVFSGCLPTEGVYYLGMISTRDPGVQYRVLQPDVTGTHCGGKRGVGGDVGEAVAMALASVPDANALVEVDVFSYGGWYREHCVRVEGAAAVLNQ